MAHSGKANLLLLLNILFYILLDVCSIIMWWWSLLSLDFPNYRRAFESIVINLPIFYSRTESTTEPVALSYSSCFCRWACFQPIYAGLSRAVCSPWADLLMNLLVSQRPSDQSCARFHSPSEITDLKGTYSYGDERAARRSQKQMRSLLGPRPKSAHCNFLSYITAQYKSIGQTWS